MIRQTPACAPGYRTIPQAHAPKACAHRENRNVRALHGAGVEKGLLHRRQFAILLQPLDGFDLTIGGRRGDNQTGPHRLAVEQDVARTAESLIAAALGAVQAHLLAQNVEQGGRAIGAHLTDFAVDLQIELLHRIHVTTPPGIL